MAKISEFLNSCSPITLSYRHPVTPSTPDEHGDEQSWNLGSETYSDFTLHKDSIDDMNFICVSLTT